jgi:hypothetical protein
MADRMHTLLRSRLKDKKHIAPLLPVLAVGLSALFKLLSYRVPAIPSSNVNRATILLSYRPIRPFLPPPIMSTTLRPCLFLIVVSLCRTVPLSLPHLYHELYFHS